MVPSLMNLLATAPVFTMPVEADPTTILTSIAAAIGVAVAGLVAGGVGIGLARAAIIFGGRIPGKLIK